MRLLRGSAIALIALAAAACSTPKPLDPHTTNDSSQQAAAPPPDVLAWVLPYENSLQSLGRFSRYLTIVSPTYYRLNVDANNKSVKLEDWDPNVPFPRARLGANANAVFPLVGCIGPCGPKISRVIDDEAASKTHIADLLRVSRDPSFKGLTIDYEDVDASEANVSRFVEDLAKGLHDANKQLILVIQEPCGIDPTCKRSPYPFAIKSLIKKVDRLVVMEYDFVVDGSGPPAPRAWVEKGLKRVATEVGEGSRDLQKVLCAVPFYGRVTKGVADDTAVLFDEVRPSAGTIRNAKVTVGPMTLDANALSKIATVKGAQVSGTLYLEDRDTIRARVALAAQFKLGGVAIWRLGGEDPCIANELAKARGVEAPACPSSSGH